jgi:hypothetical protein
VDQAEAEAIPAELLEPRQQAKVLRVGQVIALVLHFLVVVVAVREKLVLHLALLAEDTQETAKQQILLENGCSFLQVAVVVQNLVVVKEWVDLHSVMLKLETSVAE